MSTEKLLHLGSDETPSSRREFLEKGLQLTLSGAAMHACIGCSNSPPPESIEVPKRTKTRNIQSDHFDNLSTNQSIIGKEFTLSITLENGSSEKIIVQFEDNMTIIIDGDTHSMSSICIAGKTLSKDEEVPVIGKKVSDVLSDVRPNTENTGILFESEYGQAHISQAELKKMLTALKHPEKNKEDEQNIVVHFDVALSADTQVLVDSGKTLSRCVNALSGKKGGGFTMPDSCTITFKSSRKPKEEPIARNLESASQIQRGVLRRFVGNILEGKSSN